MNKVLTCQRKIKKAEISEYSVKYLRNWGWKASVYAGFRRAERKWNKPVQGIDTPITATFYKAVSSIGGNGTSPFRALTHVVFPVPSNPVITRKWNKPVQGIDTQ